jgi:hypothetical protein
MTNEPGILGIDIGNTIVDSNLSPHQPFPDALRVIKRLVAERFRPERTFIVSKVNEEQKLRAMDWLAKTGFHEITGIPENHVEFCAERSDKAPICQRLSITHFIDDRPEVLSHMGTVQNRILFRAIEEDFEFFKARLEGVVRVSSWAEVERLLLT